MLLTVSLLTGSWSLIGFLERFPFALGARPVARLNPISDKRSVLCVFLFVFVFVQCFCFRNSPCTETSKTWPFLKGSLCARLRLDAYVDEPNGRLVPKCEDCGVVLYAARKQRKNQQETWPETKTVLSLTIEARADNGGSGGHIIGLGLAHHTVRWPF